MIDDVWVVGSSMNVCPLSGAALVNVGIILGLIVRFAEIFHAQNYRCYSYARTDVKRLLW